MLIPILLILGGIALLYFGAEWLVSGASRLAKRFGIRPLIIGLTVVAFGTSAPELFSSLVAQLSLGAGSVAVGNVVGSNIYNVGLVLGLSALIFPVAVHSTVVKREAPICVFVTILVILFMWNGTISRIESFGLIALFLAYTVYQFIEARRSRDEMKLSGEFEAILADRKQQSTLFLFALIIIGSVALAAGAFLLVDNGVSLGRLFGISDRVIGLTVVAIGTSLPELATAIVAARQKHSDLLVGNVIGSNIFNILLIVGVVGSLSPLTFDPALMQIDAPFMLALTVFLMFLLLTGRKLHRWQGSLLLIAAVAYTGYLYRGGIH